MAIEINPIFGALWPVKAGLMTATGRAVDIYNSELSPGTDPRQRKTTKVAPYDSPALLSL